MAATKTKPTGRKRTNITKELKTNILNRISMGCTLKETCREFNVSVSGVRLHLVKDNLFKEEMEIARRMQAWAYLDDIIEIAENKELDVFENEEGKRTPNPTNVARDTLIIKTKTKAMSFLHPKRFNEKTNVDVTSSDGTVFGGLTIIGDKLKGKE
jgi:hypothetical protein